MVTIINAHHEKWLDLPKQFDDKLPRLVAIWEQLAARFANKTQTLLFEIFNEPHLMSTEQLNAMYAAVLPVIRKHNPTRIVLINGLKFGNPSWILSNPDALTIPSDTQLMLEIHNYDPFKYAGAHPTQHSWGSASDRAAMSDWVDGIDAWSKKKRLPIYYGEFGLTNAQSSANGRDAWFQAHRAAIASKGWGASVWSDGGGHLVFNYETGAWDDQVLVDLGVRPGGPTPPPSPPSPPSPSSCAAAYKKCGGGPHYSGPKCCQGSCT